MLGIGLAGVVRVIWDDSVTGAVNDPSRLLGMDRASTAFVAQSIVFSAVGAFKLTGGHVGWQEVVVGLCFATSMMLAFQAWGRFLVARTYLAATGRLPWRLMAFLREAHRKGVLRQAGPVYQFRHARLRDQLAEEYEQTERS